MRTKIHSNPFVLLFFFSCLNVADALPLPTYETSPSSPTALRSPIQRHHLSEFFFPRPPSTDDARLARWLVHANLWGVLSTSSRHLGHGFPFGSAVSLSDGPASEATGRLLFYLTAMDATAQDLTVNPNATLTLCEAQLPGGCAGWDPEDPNCAKLSISGAVRPLNGGAASEARELLFARHPAMRDWPAGHDFRVYEMSPATLRLLDAYGGAKDIAPEEYWAAGLDAAV